MQITYAIPSGSFDVRIPSMDSSVQLTLTGGTCSFNIVATTASYSTTSSFALNGGGGLPVLFGTSSDPNGVISGSIYQFYKNNVSGELFVNQDGTPNGWI